MKETRYVIYWKSLMLKTYDAEKGKFPDPKRVAGFIEQRAEDNEHEIQHYSVERQERRWNRMAEDWYPWKVAERFNHEMFEIKV